MPRFIGLWRHGDFLRFWSSQILSLSSIQMSQLAFPLTAILTLDASPSQLGILAGLGSTPWLVFGLFAGIGIDRVRRRPVLVVAHLGRAGLVASVPVAALMGALTIEQLYLVAFTTGSLAVLFETAYHAYLPSLVSPEGLADANARLAVTSGITRIAGPGIAGAIVQILTPIFGVAMSAASYAASGILVWRIRQPEHPPSRQGHPPVGDALREGLTFIRAHALVRAFTISEGTYIFFFSLIQAMLLVFCTRILGLSPGVIGVVFSTGSAGGLFGALMAHRIGERFTPGTALISGSVLRAAGLAIVPLTAISGSFAIPMLIASRVINAFGWAIWQVHQETTQQLVTPDAMRGRVTGSSLFLVRGAGAFGGYIAAIMASQLGLVPVVVVSSFGTLLSVPWLLKVHTLADTHMASPTRPPCR